MSKVIDKAIKVCDFKTYVLKAYSDFEDSDMSNIISKGLS